MSVKPVVIKRVLAGLMILAIGTILGVFVISPPQGETATVAVAENRATNASVERYNAMAEFYTRDQRSIDANAARYNAMAAFFGVDNRSIEASAARYNAMAAFYAARGESWQRSIDASTARYDAMVEYYGR
jgi:hypothetical protein